MQRRLTLACTLVHEPELLFLDEPTAGVDPILRDRFWTHFRALRDEGRTIVVSTQYVNEAVSCDFVAVMAHGRIVTIQPPDQLAKTAYGGQPVLISLEEGTVTRQTLERLAALPFVQSARRVDAGALVVVDDEARIPELDQHYGMLGIQPVAPTQVAEPSFDDIFVEIIRRAELADDARQAA
jgi:ABC-2 type transport system ATP-binding protein